MKVEFTTKKLRSAVTILERVDKPSQLDLTMGYFILEISKGNVTMRAQNETHDIYIDYLEKVSKKIEYKVAVNTRTLFDTIKLITDPVVFVDTDCKKEFVMTTEEGAEYKIGGIDVERFRERVKVPEWNYMELSAEQVETIIKKVVPFVSTDDMRPGMMGVLTEMDESDNEVAFVSTDGVRLGRLVFDKEIKKTDKQIIPPNTFKIIDSIKLYDGENWTIGIDAMYIKTTGETDDGFLLEITTTAITDNFPEYGRIIPNKKDAEIKVEYCPDDMQRTVNRMMKISELNHPSVYLKINGKTNVYTLNYKGTKIIGDEELSGSAIQEGEAMIRMGSRFLHEQAKAMNNSDTMRLFIQGEKRAVLFEEQDPGYYRYESILMPQFYEDEQRELINNA